MPGGHGLRPIGGLGSTPMLQPQQVQGRTIPLQYGRWVQWDLTSWVEIMHTYRCETTTEGMNASRPASSSQNGHAGGRSANGWNGNGWQHGKAIHADAWTTQLVAHPKQLTRTSTNKPTTTSSSRACAMEANSWWSTW